MATIQFKPKQTTKKLISVLPDRAKQVIISRYGLGKKTEKMTLDSIGKQYGITRERVRQIENYALANIRKSDVYKTEKSTFAELETLLHSLGGIVVEEDFLGHVAKWSIWVFAILAALFQLGIAPALVQTLFMGIVVAAALATGLAFGLGGKDVAGKILEKTVHSISDKE